MDSSSIIPFLRAGQLSVFHDLWEDVSVPRSVFEEINNTLEGASVFSDACDAWISVKEIDPDKAEKLAGQEGLTPVDAEVLLLALEEKSSLVCGDRALILAAKAHGVPCIWTTEVLLEAVARKKRSADSALEILDRMIQNGLRLRTDVYAAVRKTIRSLQADSHLKSVKDDVSWGLGKKI